MKPIAVILLITIISGVLGQQSSVCVDQNSSCKDWAANNGCVPGSYVWINCRPSCRLCDPQSPVGTIPATQPPTTTHPIPLPPEFDARNLPFELQSLSFLLGEWRSELDGKAIFPTIPVFTYGEKVSFSIADPRSACGACLNYSAKAWGFNSKQDLHSETGFIKSDGRIVSMITSMNNGFTMVEEGSIVSPGKFETRMKAIGRASFGRDLPVTSAMRSFEAFGDGLMQTFYMGTLTDSERQHTRNFYKRVDIIKTLQQAQPQPAISQSAVVV